MVVRIVLQLLLGLIASARWEQDIQQLMHCYLAHVT